MISSALRPAFDQQQLNAAIVAYFRAGIAGALSDPGEESSLDNLPTAMPTDQGPDSWRRMRPLSPLITEPRRSAGEPQAPSSARWARIGTTRARRCRAKVATGVGWPSTVGSPIRPLTDPTAHRTDRERFTMHGMQRGSNASRRTNGSKRC